MSNSDAYGQLSFSPEFCHRHSSIMKAWQPLIFMDDYGITHIDAISDSVYTFLGHGKESFSSTITDPGFDTVFSTELKRCLWEDKAKINITFSNYNPTLEMLYSESGEISFFKDLSKYIIDYRRIERVNIPFTLPNIESMDFENAVYHLDDPRDYKTLKEEALKEGISEKDFEKIVKNIKLNGFNQGLIAEWELEIPNFFKNWM